MRFQPRWWLAFCMLLFARPAQATIHYTISLAQPERHLFHVTMVVPDAKDELVVAIPAWTALYQIRDFSHRVQDVRARGEGNLILEAIKSDGETWRIRRRAVVAKPAATASAKPLGQVTIEYAIYWDEANPFSAQLNASHAFVNLAAVLFYVPDRRSEGTELTFTDVPASWKVAVALPATEDGRTLRAASYDALVDAPVEASTFEEFRLEAGGARLRVVVHGSEGDRAFLMDSVRRIVAYEVGLMREVPFGEYLFIYHFGANSDSGMEHSNSTAIDVARGSSPINVTAHEFFHLWNVKRIRPRSLEPACPDCREVGRGVDYTRENWTRSLWFAEGVTSTYGAYTLVRSGLWTPRQFYDDLGDQISELESRPAHLWQSVEQSSLDAWNEKYQLYRRPEFSISYYNKGQILGVLLDILIRDATDNKASLDDVMRQMNRDFAHRGRFYDDSADICRTAERVAGRDFKEFFARYVAGTGPLPYQEIFALAGLELISRGDGSGRYFFIREARDATPKQRRIREGLLRGTTD